MEHKLTSGTLHSELIKSDALASSFDNSSASTLGEPESTHRHLWQCEQTRVVQHLVKTGVRADFRTTTVARGLNATNTHTKKQHRAKKWKIKEMKGTQSSSQTNSENMQTYSYPRDDNCYCISGLALKESGNAGSGNDGTVNTAHAKSVQDDLVESRCCPTDEELVKLDQQPQVRIIAVGCGALGLPVVRVDGVNTL